MSLIVLLVQDMVYGAKEWISLEENKAFLKYVAAGVLLLEVSFCVRTAKKCVLLTTTHLGKTHSYSL